MKGGRGRVVVRCVLRGWAVQSAVGVVCLVWSLDVTLPSNLDPYFPPPSLSLPFLDNSTTDRGPPRATQVPPSYRSARLD